MYYFGFRHNVTAGINAAEAKSKASGVASELQNMRRELERSALAWEALWTLMRDKLGVTQEELQARIDEIDLSDGELDGRVRRAVVPCPNCERPVNRRLRKCMYCQAPVPREGLP
jgi:hypothetical protein